MKNRGREGGVTTSFGAANFQKRSVPAICGMEEVAMKLIFSGVNSSMVYVHAMTTEPCDQRRHLRGLSTRALQERKPTGRKLVRLHMSAA